MNKDKVNGRTVLGWAIVQDIAGGGLIRRSIELYEPRLIPQGCRAVAMGAIEEEAESEPLPTRIARAMAKTYIAGFQASAAGWSAETLRAPEKSPQFLEQMRRDLGALIPEITAMPVEAETPVETQSSPPPAAIAEEVDLEPLRELLKVCQINANMGRRSMPLDHVLKCLENSIGGSKEI